MRVASHAAWRESDGVNLTVPHCCQAGSSMALPYPMFERQIRLRLTGMGAKDDGSSPP
jgi:hypothetical protein